MTEVWCPCAPQYSDEFVQSAYLSRRLAYFCARRLALLLSDGPNLLAAHSPHMMIGPNSSGIGAPSPGPPGPGMSPVQLAFSDFLSCAQHGPLVYGLSCMLQVSPWPFLFYVNIQSRKQRSWESKIQKADQALFSCQAALLEHLVACRQLGCCHQV